MQKANKWFILWEEVDIEHLHTVLTQQAGICGKPLLFVQIMRALRPNLLPDCQAPIAQLVGLVGWLYLGLTLSQTISIFYMPAVQILWKHCGKRRNCSYNEQFLLFPQCFSTHLENFLPFSPNWKLSSANSSSLEESKICCLRKG